MDEIALVEYDPRWPEQFAQETARVRAALGDDSVTAIEHFGSTSVPGLPAKPIIDILVGVRSVAEARHYETVKRDLAARFPEDREAYTDGKTEYVHGVMQKAREQE